MANSCTLLTVSLRHGHHRTLRARTAMEWYELGVAAERCEDMAVAAHAYGKAASLRHGLADAHNNLGRILHENGQLSQAEAHYRLALCSDEQTSLYWYNLGVVLQDTGRHAEACDAYERALELDATFSDAHHNLAQLLEGFSRRGNAAAYSKALYHYSVFQRLR